VFFFFFWNQFFNKEEATINKAEVSSRMTVPQ